DSATPHFDTARRVSRSTRQTVQRRTSSFRGNLFRILIAPHYRRMPLCWVAAGAPHTAPAAALLGPLRASPFSPHIVYGDRAPRPLASSRHAWTSLARAS